MPTARDEKIAKFIIALLGLPRVGTRTVNKFITEQADRIDSTAPLDADFVESLYSLSPTKAVVKIYSRLHSYETDSWESLEESAIKTLQLAEDANVHVLHPFMDAYPWRMLRHPSRPPILYCKGNLDAIGSDKAVAIVGTREPTDFGARMTRRLSQVLAEDGYTIVSGLALGCDTMAHEGALDANGLTVATLATPIDAPVYPRQNQDLADSVVAAGGALVSEYAPGLMFSSQQLLGNLVARDEWQPALSDGVIAAETTKNGGTHHALDHAIDRDVPIAIFDYSSRSGVDFRADDRFDGNVHYLEERGASPIFAPETIDAFKQRMYDFRQRSEELAHPADAQQSLFD